MIAIFLASLLDKYMGFETQKLTIPSKFQPTTERGWIIPLFGKNPLYTIFVAIVPAIIATILVFMDQQITAVIVNRKEFKLKVIFNMKKNLMNTNRYRTSQKI